MKLKVRIQWPMGARPKPAVLSVVPRWEPSKEPVLVKTPVEIPAELPSADAAVASVTARFLEFLSEAEDEASVGLEAEQALPDSASMLSVSESSVASAAASTVPDAVSGPFLSSHVDESRWMKGSALNEKTIRPVARRRYTASAPFISTVPVPVPVAVVVSAAPPFLSDVEEEAVEGRFGEKTEDLIFPAEELAFQDQAQNQARDQVEESTAPELVVAPEPVAEPNAVARHEAVAAHELAPMTMPSPIAPERDLVPENPIPEDLLSGDVVSDEDHGEGFTVKLTEQALGGDARPEVSATGPESVAAELAGVPFTLPAATPSPFLAALIDRAQETKLGVVKEQSIRQVPPPKQDFTATARPGVMRRAFSWLHKNYSSSAKKQLRVSETVSLGEKRFVAIIHADGQKFLIGGGSTGVSLLTQLEKNAETAEGPTLLRELTERSA